MNSELLAQKMIFCMQNEKDLRKMRLVNAREANKYHINTLWFNLKRNIA